MYPDYQRKRTMDTVAPRPMHIFINIKVFCKRQYWFLIKAQMVKIGKAPITRHKMIPETRKLEKGDFLRMDKGYPPNILSEGE